MSKKNYHYVFLKLKFIWIYIGQKLTGYEGLEKSGILLSQITRFFPLGKQVFILTFILILSGKDIKQVSSDNFSEK